MNVNSVDAPIYVQILMVALFATVIKIFCKNMETVLIIQAQLTLLFYILTKTVFLNLI